MSGWATQGARCKTYSASPSNIVSWPTACFAPSLSSRRPDPAWNQRHRGTAKGAHLSPQRAVDVAAGPAGRAKRQQALARACKPQLPSAAAAALSRDSGTGRRGPIVQRQWLDDVRRGSNELGFLRCGLSYASGWRILYKAVKYDLWENVARSMICGDSLGPRPCPRRRRMFTRAVAPPSRSRRKLASSNTWSKISSSEKTWHGYRFHIPF